ncbi:MAG: shikimate dehydrogenase [Rhodospirillales bacterium 20-64-7]|nr:MAG: shikimate dehydrogenase [Rhodospirillales bacterium 20-64-7]
MNITTPLPNSETNSATAVPRQIKLGLIGADIGPSRSPAMHEAEGRAQGLDVSYQLIDLTTRSVGVEGLPGLLAEAEAEGFAGVNVTHPCKQAVIPLLDELSEDARALGAVNTVLFQDGKRLGHNTDWYGFSEAFRRGMAGAPLSRVVQIGAGGAGSAVAYGALKLGVAQLSLVDVDQARAEALAAKLGGIFGASRVSAAARPDDVVPTADGLINTTPIGMEAYPGLPLSGALLRPNLWVAEVVYFPLDTALLQAARALGSRTVDGGGMAVFQAAEAFRLFTGVMPDVERMLTGFAAMRPIRHE